jgi:hypothetical protein
VELGAIKFWGWCLRREIQDSIATFSNLHILLFWKNQGCLCVRSTVRLVRPSIHLVSSVCPSATFDKVRVHPIRVNVLLTLDRVNLDLLCPRWLPHRCHIVATLDGRGCCGTYGWLRGAYAYLRRACPPPPPQPFAPPPQSFAPPRKRLHPPLCRERPLHMLEMLAWKSTSPSNMPCQPTVLTRGKI